MYAVIKTGGKQYRVAEGDVLDVEKLPAEEGASIDIGDVLMVVDGDQVTVGEPLVAGATVKATVTRQDRDKKIKIVKFRRRKHSRKQMGHRQSFSRLQIDKIIMK